MANRNILATKLHNKVYQYSDQLWPYEHEDYCYRVTISNDETYQHFHTFPLLPNFIEMREITQSNTPSIIGKLSLSEQQEIVSTDNMIASGLLTMLKHYGLYQCIHQLSSIASSRSEQFDDWLEAVAALELTKSMGKGFHFHQRKISSIIQITECIGVNNYKFDNLIFNEFIQYYIITALSSIHNKSIRKIQCDCYLNDKPICNGCLHNDNLSQMCSGYLLIFCAPIIHFKLKEFRSQHELKNILKLFWNTLLDWYNVEKNDFEIYYNQCDANKLRRYNVSDLRDIGRKYVLSAKKYMVESRIRDIVAAYAKNEIDDYQDAMDYFYLLAQVNFYDKKYDVAKIYYVMACCGFDGLWKRAVTLKALTVNCYKNKEYLIGLRVLRCTYKLCNGYILPSFVKKTYVQQKRKLKKKWKNMRCDYCNELKTKGNKLKSCSGCMKTFYCSRLCQKLHWRSWHRISCDLQWRQIYPMLTDQILNRL